jgi:hypothetical protein
VIEPLAPGSVSLRLYAAPAATTPWGSDELIHADSTTEIATRLPDVTRRAGADALNLRVHVPGIAPAAVHDQIALLGPAARTMFPNRDEVSR